MLKQRDKIFCLDCHHYSLTTCLWWYTKFKLSSFLYQLEFRCNISINILSTWLFVDPKSTVFYTYIFRWLAKNHKGKTTLTVFFMLSNTAQEVILVLKYLAVWKNIKHLTTLQKRMFNSAFRIFLESFSTL